MNIFDIMGPIMVGPSSSHTAGAARIGLITRHLLGNRPAAAELLLHGSFAATGKGHGTDRALVAGLVEVPCVKRNVIGAVNALTAAELALAGVENVIPCDEVIDAMRAVGDVMPTALRETGGGGLAATPTGRRIAEELLGP